MIKHYFKLGRRALFKNRYYTSINIFGLVFGMLTALIIAKFIGGSLQFDNFHQHRDNIYSISQEEFINGIPQKNSHTCYWGVGALLKQYPEVMNATRYSYHVSSLVLANGNEANKISFFENKIFRVDSSFLNIFTFPFIHGNPKTALLRSNSIVLTRSTSQRYFGDVAPIGQMLTLRVPWGAETKYEVTGVVEDIPKRSQFKFDFLTTRDEPNQNEFWNVPEYSTFVLLKNKVDEIKVSSKLEKALTEIAQLTTTNRDLKVSFKTLASIQLSRNEYLLVAVGLFIILISWVNYINQVIAQSYWRMKEIGVLKVMGATSSNLKTQFIVESSMICLTSGFLVTAIYLYLEPTLQSLTNGHILPLVNDPTLVNYAFLIIFLIGIILAAAIPTIIFSSQNFGATLRNIYSSKINGIGLRKVLVVVQFSISTILIISVFVISNQLDYMNDKDKGIDMENVLVIQEPIIRDTTWIAKSKTLKLIKDEFLALPFVTEVSASSTLPGETYRWETYLSFQDNNGKAMVHQNGVDKRFFDLFNVEFLAGQNFSSEAKWKNRRSIILNESAAKVLGIADFDNAINTKVIDHETKDAYNLIGIIKDYHKTSVKYKMEPIAFKFNPFRGHLSLKVNPNALNNKDLSNNLAAIEQIWKRTYHDASFDYYFLDDKFASQDQEDKVFGKLFIYFTVLSIIISCLGLFGLSLLISKKRQKEIGIRKVFGASSFSILAKLLKGYLAPLSIAMIIGTPVAYLLMNMWLNNYAYRTEIGLGIILLALFCLTLIFLLTVTYHTLKSSVSNPAAILRD